MVQRLHAGKVSAVDRVQFWTKSERESKGLPHGPRERSSWGKSKQILLTWSVKVQKG